MVHTFPIEKIMDTVHPSPGTLLRSSYKRLFPNLAQGVQRQGETKPSLIFFKNAQKSLATIL